MDEFCNEMKIPKEIKKKLTKALTYNSNKNCFNWADEKHIFKQLSINLRYEICMNIHDEIMKSFNFLTIGEDKFFVTKITKIPYIQLKAILSKIYMGYK